MLDRNDPMSLGRMAFVDKHLKNVMRMPISNDDRRMDQATSLMQKAKKLHDANPELVAKEYSRKLVNATPGFQKAPPFMQAFALERIKSGAKIMGETKVAQRKIQSEDPTLDANQQYRIDMKQTTIDGEAHKINLFLSNTFRGYARDE